MTTGYYEAAEMARVMHAGQVDKAGNDYFTAHIEEVVRITREELGGDIRTAVAAYLHDIVEDTSVSIETIIEVFGEDTGADVEALTHRYTDGRGEPYVEYIERIRVRGGRAVIVKHADLLDHLHNGNTIPEKMRAKYVRALAQLLA